VIPRELWTKKATVYRDRENSTVFVADLPHGVTDDDLKQLFKDVRMLARSICEMIIIIFCTKCGSIREVKITQLPGSFVATVEFVERVGRLVENFPAG
jgi:squamous cell carcinoma antigen recognized by T-cells 3